MNDRTLNKLHRIGDIVYIALTALFLTLPLVTVNLRREVAVDNRRAADFPKFSTENIEDFPRKLEAWFGDRFGGRRELIGIGNLALLKLFRESPSEQLIPGRDGFIFFASHTGGDAGRDALLRDLFVFSDEEIARESERFFVTAELLEKMPFRTSLMTVPTKHLLYFDHMPARARRFAADPDAPSVRGEEIIEETFRHDPSISREFFIDIFPEAIIAAPAIQLIPPENFHWVEGPYTDLAAILTARHFGVSDDIWLPEAGHYRSVRIKSDLRHFIHPKQKTTALVTADEDFREMGITDETRTEAFLPRLTARLGAADGVVFYSANAEAPGGRMLLWGDSFTNPLRRDMARYFREVVSMEYSAVFREDPELAAEYTVGIIEEFRPEFVVIVNHVDAAVYAEEFAKILTEHFAVRGPTADGSNREGDRICR